MLISLRKKAQSTAEYVIILGLAVGAVVAMQTFVKRGLQGRLRDATNYVDNGGQASVFTGHQYEPYYISSNFESSSNQESGERVETSGGEVARNESATSNRTGNQTISNAEDNR